MFNKICRAHYDLVMGYNHQTVSNSADLIRLEKLRLSSIRSFKILVAPLLVTSLFVIKQCVLNPSPNLEVEVKTSENLINNNNESGDIKKNIRTCM